MAGDDMDRTEQATPYKLQKAREKGQVPKSADIVSVVVFITAVVFLYWQGPELLLRQFQFDRALLLQAGRIDLNEASLWQLVGRIAWHCLMLLAPFFMAIGLAAIVGNLVQTGPMFSTEPLKMDWSRLDPVQGFKKMLSLRRLFDSARVCVKLGVLSLVGYFTLASLAPQFATLGTRPPVVVLGIVIGDVASIGLKMGLVLALIAAVDLLFSRREFARQMRMSRREVKDESKNRDGDPRIRSRLRQLRQEMLKRSASTRNTGKADVLIVNPTHFAVALKYVHGQMESPQLLAKGSGAFAAAMRRIAVRHNIPIVQNVTLARKLFRELDIDQHVPSAMYADVARIIVWVFAMRKARETGTARAAAGQGSPA